MTKTFYSNGKLLITGEYTVLDGADAFALPTKRGQYLHIKETDGQAFEWTGKDADGTIWLELKIPFSDVIQNRQASNTSEYNTLVNILHEAHKANPSIINNSNGFNVITELTFPRHWGLGSSSTLINNIAQWFNINAFKLLADSFGGSGYDIACAQNNNPIIYSLQNREPTVTEVQFSPGFTDKLYFVYLNQKQNSRSAIEAYKQKRSDILETVSKINTLTTALLKAHDLITFRNVLDEHENIMSVILQMPTVKERLFSDFNGSVKSLGAWGGDFVLAVSDDDPITYFKERGYDVVILYAEMILK